MQQNIINSEGVNFRIYTDSSQVNHPAAPIEEYALRRVFGMKDGVAKTVDFLDLPGYWKMESVYISSPEESEILIQIIDENGIAFFSDKLFRNETPKQLPTVLVNTSVKLKLTAYKSPIILLLIYLKPAFLGYMKDF